MAGDGDGLSSRTVFLLSRMSPSSEGMQEPPVCEVDPLDIAETSGLVRDRELKGRLGCRSLGEFTIIPEDSPREKEGRQ